MEAMLDHGETLLVPERVIIAPDGGRVPAEDVSDARGGAVGRRDRSGRGAWNQRVGSEPVRGHDHGDAGARRRTPASRSARGLAAGGVTGLPIAVVGWGYAVPDGRVTNADLAARVDTNDAWIVDRTGIRERRIAGPGETTATPRDDRGRGRDQARRAPPTTSTCSSSRRRRPEQPMPHTGAFVGEGSGSTAVRSTSRGRVRGVRVRARDRRVDARHRRPGHVLVIGAETLRRIVDPDDRTTLVLFGDAAAGVVLNRAAPATARAARVGSRLRRLGDRSARDPGRREPPPDDPGDGRGAASTT